MTASGDKLVSDNLRPAQGASQRVTFVLSERVYRPNVPLWPSFPFFDHRTLAEVMADEQKGGAA